MNYKTLLTIIILIAIAVGLGWLANQSSPAPQTTPEAAPEIPTTSEQTPTTPEDSDSNTDSETLRETDACQAKCRDQYGGSGSAGFEACVRACGESSIFREACPEDRPACPEGEPLFCRYGKWVCGGEAQPVGLLLNKLLKLAPYLKTGSCLI